ncbi:hypothetical protein CCB81_02150 [Armatimonadetes bacterium Uphvl-Ar2]|nr:hypothetical protein CCB81_02150 [Armatimonadetes bacterium Uphvl-Ar2]
MDWQPGERAGAVGGHGADCHGLLLAAGQLDGRGGTPGPGMGHPPAVGGHGIHPQLHPRPRLPVGAHGHSALAVPGGVAVGGAGRHLPGGRLGGAGQSVAGRVALAPGRWRDEPVAHGSGRGYRRFVWLFLVAGQHAPRRQLARGRCRPTGGGPSLHSGGRGAHPSGWGRAGTDGRRRTGRSRTGGVPRRFRLPQRVGGAYGGAGLPPGGACHPGRQPGAGWQALPNRVLLGRHAVEARQQNPPGGVRRIRARARRAPVPQELQPPGGGPDPGDRVQSLPVGPFQAGPLLCFEGLFPDLALAQQQAGAQLLTVQAIDDWYAATPAWEQLYPGAVFRSIEAGLPVVRAGSKGRSYITDARGNIVSWLPHRDQGLLTARVRVPAGGDGWTGRMIFPWLCLAVALAVMVANLISLRSKKEA